MTFLLKEFVINYLAWLGHGNLGDEALYLAAQKIFSPYRLVPYYPDLRPSGHSRITIMGGGTLLPTLALSIPNKYNYAYGVGVKHPDFWGEFHPFVIELIKRFNFRFLGVRGNTSKELLKDWGIESEVIGDPCLLLEPRSYKKRKKKLVAINVGQSRGRIWGGNEERVSKETVRLCNFLKQEGYYPILIPFWKDDISYIQRISKAANVDIFENWDDIVQVIDLIASCYIVIGEKLHSTVFSASTYTPFISLEYRPKCLEFAQSMGFGKYTIRTDTMNAEKTMRLFHDLLDNWGEMRSLLVRKVEEYRGKLRGFATRIISDIKSLPDESTPGILENQKRVIVYGADVYLYYRFKRVWKAWYQLPIRRRVKHYLDLLRTLLCGT